MEGIFQSKWFWFLGILFVLSPLIVVFGIVWIPKLPFFKPPPPAPSPPPQEETIPVSALPVAPEILKNPLVYEWRGSVEGILIEKDDKSITLEKDGERITLPIDPSPNGVKFYTKESLKVTAEPIKEDTFLTIDKISIGTRLRGEFWVFADRKEQIFTGSFTVIEQ